MISMNLNTADWFGTVPGCPLNATPLLAQSESAREIVYSPARAASIDGWWMWASLVFAAFGLIALCITYYHRDAAELSRPVRISLITLRVLTIAALLFFFLDVVRRTQRTVIRQSEIAILVDTSQSMSLPMDTNPQSEPRIDRARQLLSSTKLVDQFAAKHRTHLYAFGDSATPELIQSSDQVSEANRPGDAPEEDGSDTDAKFSAPLNASPLALVGIALTGLGLVIGLISLVVGGIHRTGGSSSDLSRHPSGPWILVSSVILPVGIITLGVAAAIHADRSMLSLVGGQTAVAAESAETAKPVLAGDQRSDVIDPANPDIIDGQPAQSTNLDERLVAAAPQSRIGDAVRSVLNAHDASTLAGVVVISDGQTNGGIDLSAAIASARRNEVAVIPVGMGSDASPVNVRIVDLDAPRRVYPGDKFAISAVLQASGSEPMEIEVQLLDELDDGQSGESSGNGQSPSGTGTDTAGNDESAIGPPSQLIQTKTITVTPDSKLITLDFEMEPEEVGRRRLAVRIVPPAADQNEADNIRDARYEVVARKLRVLAVAGGPTREYRFVRNLLFRDSSIRLDVFLQTGGPGISQDADTLLTEMPATAEALFEYDAIMMFDPDWTSIDLATIELIDRYLAQQAGGLILIAGPVYHPQWIRRRTDPRLPAIAGFFPVTFSAGSPVTVGGRSGGDSAWPLELTPEAARTDFFQVAGTPAESLEAWREFGVFDYVSVKGTKPGAKVYAYFSDPTTQIGGSLPVFLASQFYGAGRVLFCRQWRDVAVAGRGRIVL